MIKYVLDYIQSYIDCVLNYLKTTELKYEIFVPSELCTISMIIDSKKIKIYIYIWKSNKVNLYISVIKTQHIIFDKRNSTYEDNSKG